MKNNNLTKEFIRCYVSVPYFIDTYCQIENKQTGEWVPFRLWPKQREVAKLLQTQKFVAALKARQVGFSWLEVARCLHKMLFVPNCLVGMWSRRDDESIELLRRLREMHKRLPAWLAGDLLRDNSSGNNTHTYILDNGSSAKAFPTTAGDSYTVAIAFIDEADLMSNLNKLLRSVKPTIDAGGQLHLISRPDKDNPESSFKRIYRDALERKNSYCPIFANWRDRPDRTNEWYEEEKRNSLSTTGSLDDLYEQYPETQEQALAARILNKRLPPEWLQQCFDVQDECNHDCTVPDVHIYIKPEIGMRFCIGADPAEGLKGSDDSAAVVFRDDGKQAARLNGKMEISIFAENLVGLSNYFNQAGVLVERNNHGHAVLTRLTDTNIPVRNGRDGRKGWLTDPRGKTEMYASVADGLRDQQTTIADRLTFAQLSSIERSTLSAPEGQLDDVATAYGLGKLALAKIDSSIGHLEVV